jgi:ribose 5-phosphate isomerase B
MPSAKYQVLVYNILMKIALGADHAGFELKEKIKQHLLKHGMLVNDLGTHSTESVDYPDYARAVGEEVARRRADWGILVCGAGIGMCIAANKVMGIRAANIHSEIEAQLSREHNNANVLALGARLLDHDLALRIVDRWLNTAFAGGRHAGRVEKISAIELREVTST